MNLNDRDVPLSEAGQERRRAMLATLQEEMGALRRHRRRRRHVAVVGSAAIVLAAVVGIGLWPATDRAPVSHDSVAERAPARTVVEFSVIETDAEILDRYLIRSTGGSSVERLDDDGLMAELAAIDPGLGLIRVGDRAWVWGLDGRMLSR